MIRIINATFVFLIFVGCATKSIQTMEQGERDKLNYNFSSVNGVIAGKYFTANRSYEKFTEVDYDNLLSPLKSDKAEELKESLKDFNQKSVIGFSDGIVVCAFSTKYGFGLCDTTECEGTENKEVRSVGEFDSATEELKTFSCPKRI